MLKEGVRLDRVRGGRQKYRRNPTANPYQIIIPQQASTYIVPTCLEEIKILETLACSEPEMLSIEILDIINKTDCKSLLTDDGSIDSIMDKWNGSAQDILCVLSDIYDKELVGVITWAKQIPGNLKENNRNYDLPFKI